MYAMNHSPLLFCLLFCLSIGFIECAPQPDGSLPVLGFTKVEDGDTSRHTIPAFSFINQDSQTVNNATFSGKAYVVDFFFTSCPTICPIVKQQMLRLYQRYEQDERLLLLSHSIDTRNDSVPVLHKYASKLGVSAPKWNFVTGNHDEIYEIADDYFSIAIVNPDAPGGFDHSGRLILVDKNRHVRAFCDGTDAESVTAFMEDIDKLLAEEY